jgi:topoisomerase-4 subunit A
VEQLESLMRRNFLEYSSYFVLDRAIPDLRDGFKPVQRRILSTLFNMNDGRYHKVAGVIGETMKLHPHGDASIGDALVVLANKDYFIDRQGNFGNLHTGHRAAAPRYIECRLTELALETLFHKPLTEFAPSYDGRNEEPVFLPAKLPVILMLGTEGIAVGMATKLLPHNLVELWEAQIAILEGKRPELFPDFPQGGLMDVDAYDDGQGKVDVRARVEVRDKRHVVITELPYGTTTESIIASIEAAVQKGRVKVSSIDDYTTEHVEIELTLARGVSATELIPQLYAYTDCAVSISSNLTVIMDRKPQLMTVSEIIRLLSERLREQLKAELEYDRERLTDRQHWLTLEQIFVEKRVYKRIEEATTDKAVRDEVMKGMAKYKKLFVRPMVDDDVKRLLEVRIRRISAYDIEKNRKDIDDIVVEIKKIDAKLKNMKKTAIGYVKGLIDKYGAQYPRRTEITKIKAVDKKKVARQNIKLAYDKASGFFGSDVRGDSFKLTVSEFDMVLGISNDGSYRVMTPPEKLLFTGKLIYCAAFDPDEGQEFTVVYRDKAKMCFAKTIKIHKFIRNKEYKLIGGTGGKVDLLLWNGETGELKLDFVPAKRQRVKTATFDLSALEQTGTGSRGTRLAAKPVAKLKFEAAKSKSKSKSKSKPGSKPARKRAATRGVGDKKSAPQVDDDGQGKLL